MSALLALAAAATAGRGIDMDVKRADLVLADFAKCSIKSDHDVAKQVVLGRPVDSLSDRELQRTFDPRCMGMWGVSLRATAVAMEGSLAEELVRRDLGHWPELNPTDIASLDWSVAPTLKPGPAIRRISPALLQKIQDIFVRDARIGHLGECVVRANPKQAAAVLETKMYSRDETTAFERLKPAIVGCVAAGESGSFGRSGLRHAMALSYCRMANAAPTDGQHSPVVASMYAHKPVSTSVYSNMPESVAIQALHNFGACVVSRTPKGAREILSADFNSPDYEQSMQRYLRGHDYCIPFDARMSSSGLLFAGAVAEALLKSDVKAGELSRWIEFDPQRDVIAARGPAEAMALCTVFAAPQVTARIFETEPATPEETAAMQPLGGVLSDCLRKGAQVTINKPALRSLLALAAWRIVNTPRKPVP